MDPRPYAIGRPRANGGRCGRNDHVVRIIHVDELGGESNQRTKWKHCITNKNSALINNGLSAAPCWYCTTESRNRAWVGQLSVGQNNNQIMTAWKIFVEKYAGPIISSRGTKCIIPRLSGSYPKKFWSRHFLLYPRRSQRVWWKWPNLESRWIPAEGKLSLELTVKIRTSSMYYKSIHSNLLIACLAQGCNNKIQMVNFVVFVKS
jgi:hypothetical protein